MKTAKIFILSALSTAPIAAAHGKTGKLFKSDSSSSSKSGIVAAGKSGKIYKSESSSSLQSGKDPRALLADMDNPYPGYTGDVNPSGSVTVTFPEHDLIEFAFNLQGLEPGCTGCGIHIHTGTTCDIANDVSGHYFSVAVDPWTADGGAIYDADENGAAIGSYRSTTGFDTYSENVGHAVVIHAQDGTRLSCGILRARDDSSSGNGSSKSGKKSKMMKGSKASGIARRALLADMDNPYPGYTGDVNPSGSVTVTFPEHDVIEFAFNLQGLEPGCTGCGIHIHTGTTCDIADDVSGHYFSVAVDPWTADGGAIYDADENGAAMGSYRSTTGFDTYSENVGHAVVIHAQDGTRLSCGILRAKNLR